MKAVAVILSMAILTGCTARVVQQADTSQSKWEEPVNHFWLYFIKLGDRRGCADPGFCNLITTSIYELRTYIHSTSKSQLSSDCNVQRLVTKLNGDMLDVKEQGILFKSQQIKSMGQQNVHEVQRDIRAFANGLRDLLGHRFMNEHQISQNQDTVEPFVQQSGDTTSQRQAEGLSQHQQTQTWDLSHQHETQGRVLVSTIE
ncbi:apolipoprotein Eb-like [Phycodurus eques]|uniref:apolipoprotein Eb-like n=1 Tax=Phycodurus eques TaxID=693459 RepID=UPI002ACD90C1|nr:apolipoprotein Eb-like [Phycodurus eques]